MFSSFPIRTSFLVEVVRHGMMKKTEEAQEFFFLFSCDNMIRGFLWRRLVLMHTDYDQLLSVQTGNLRTQKRNQHSLDHHPYEATPYPLLYPLFQSLSLQKNDQFVDFGSGKGRLLFYVHHLFNIPVTGIEYDPYLYQKSKANKNIYLKQRGNHHPSIHIENKSAERYEIKKEDNIFYFFNPFSVAILKVVLQNISQSVSKFTRKVNLIFYYPLCDYIHYIDRYTNFSLRKEIKIPHLYSMNPKERFLIYQN